MLIQFLDNLGLTTEQIEKIMSAIRKEHQFRLLLLDEKLPPKICEAIIRGTTLDEVDLSDEQLLRSKIRVEYYDLLPKNRDKGRR